MTAETRPDWLLVQEPHIRVCRPSDLRKDETVTHWCRAGDTAWQPVSAASLPVVLHGRETIEAMKRGGEK